ncbi:MAG: DNA methyltransferase [Sedimentisphaerales bacterium]
MKIADKINSLHSEISTTTKMIDKLQMMTLEKAGIAGELLVKQKKLVGHGNWEQWMRNNLKFSFRTAEKYITVYEHQHVFKSAPGADLKTDEIPPTINKFLDYVSKVENQGSFYFSENYVTKSNMRKDFADNGISYRKPKVEKFINPSIKNIINTVYNGNCLKVMQDMLDDGMKVSLIPTSIPYNARKYYGNGFDDSQKHNKYLDDIRKFIKLSYALLRTGGRLAIIYDEMSNKEDESSYVIPLGRHISNIAEEVGFAQLCNIDWIKFDKAKGKTCFGSYGSPSLPYLRNIKENIVVFSKEQFKLANIEKTKSDITSDEFMKWAVNVWEIMPNTEQFVPHPSIFPTTLIERVIKLFSWKNDIVLDPFAGICTTGVAAKMCGRRFICIEQNVNYCQYGRDRIEYNIDGKAVGDRMKELYPSYINKWKKMLEHTAYERKKKEKKIAV